MISKETVGILIHEYNAMTRSDAETLLERVKRDAPDLYVEYQYAALQTRLGTIQIYTVWVYRDKDDRSPIVLGNVGEWNYCLEVKRLFEKQPNE